MKPYSLLLFIALLGWGCDKTIETPVTPAIPDTVVQSIAGKFNQPTDFTITNLQTEGLFAADFQAQNNHYQAIISENGTLLTLEQQISVAAMPQNSQRLLEHQYPNSTIAYLYAQLDPTSNATIGYFTKTIYAGKEYLLSFDTLGGRISVEEEPDTVWWRYPVRNVDYLQQNIRTAINAAQPLAQFQSAALLVDARQQQRWRVTTVHDSFLNHFEFDGNGVMVNNKLEDLFGLDVPDVSFEELPIQNALNMDCQNYLAAHFQGWEFQRCIVRYETIGGNNIPLNIVVKINVGQAIYYTYFDTGFNFTGATRG